MATVTFCGTTYSCTTAFKGDDYVRLLDADGLMIAAFEGINDFSGFSIADGSWTTPADPGACPIAVVREDGTVGKCSKTIDQLLTAATPFTGTIVLSDGVQYGTSLPSSGVEGQLFFKI